MTGKEMYLLGTVSEAARACIPMELQQTAPRLVWKDGWAAQFWYYALDSETMMISNPQFFLELELPAGHPIKMERFSVKADQLGDGSDLLEPAFHPYLERYLKECEELLQAPPDPEKMKKMWKKWKMTCPFVLAAWLQEHLADAESEIFREERPADPLLAKDPVAYWKKMQAKAIREGDDTAAQKARMEMNKAASKLRKR